MKKICILLTVLAIAYSGQSQTTTARLDTLLQAYSQLYKFNGTMLVAKNGTILLDKGYGYRNAREKVVHDKNSVFQIGSVTKQFTDAVILKLQEQGKLSVQDKLSKYFPNFPKADSITIENLMSHTSGIYSYTSNRKFMDTGVSKPATREQMISLFINKPFDFSPGAGWKYSNSGYMLLGYIIEDVSKKSYYQAVRDHIFTPLHMTHSGFDFTHLQVKEKSIGYFALNAKDTLASPIVDSTVCFAAGAIYSTTGDLYRWHQALEQNKILTKAQQEKAYTPIKNKYGYGWEVDSLEGKRKVSHSGGIHGFSSNFSRVPADDVCIILLTNSSPVLNEITKSIYAILYDKPYEIPRPRVAIQLPDEKLQQYVGEYTINEHLQLTIVLKNGELQATPTGQPTAILLPEKEDYFFVRAPEVQMEFTRNDKKEIDGFILYQNGGKTKCPKVK
jgi:CubicO group peptidase (beta-lactamase class C family)